MFVLRSCIQYSGFAALYYSDFATLVLLNANCEVNTGSPPDITPCIAPYP